MSARASTVQRDLAKLDRYVKGLVSRRAYLLEQERRQELNSLPIATLLQRFKRLTELMNHTRKLSRQQEQRMHNLSIYVDLDNLDSRGVPIARSGVHNDKCTFPINVWLYIIKNGQPSNMGAMTIG